MIYVFTTCALNYFPNARILAQSVRRHMPDVRLVFCLTDAAPEGFDATQEGFDEYWTLEDLRPQIPDLEQWIFQHTVMEMATASKPFVLHALLERDDCDGVLFFDPDCEVHSPCTEIRQSLSENSITLTPHACLPHEEDPWVFFELSLLKVGAFNLGFFGVRNDEEGRQFARWWRHRLRNFCLIDESRHLFTDQKWIDLVPVYFDSVRVLRRPTYNVARWNTFQRKLTRGEDGTVLVDGEPLDFIHFSGFLKKGSYVRGLYDAQSAQWCAEIEVLDALSEDYANRLAADQARPEMSAPWGLGLYADGVEIPPRHRTAYRVSPDLRAAFPNPFEGGETLRARMATAPTEPAPAKKKKKKSALSRLKRKLGL
ncbi:MULTISPECIES: glycosyl transferase [unclassified Meridianimarinicoccus]|uniref:glycosyl transferase n=1 Tax=unclassified Meridianimarinicoccus TaxID=2923344 RepID=UPI001865EAF5|nr:glycosyl transferase [Fluviibacterium sp. MJW13]